MIWIHSTSIPEAAERRLHLGQPQYTVNYSVEALPEADTATPNADRYRYRSITLAPGIWSYDAIVNAIVTAQYPRDRMDAVVNNYLADQSNPDLREEFDEMQKARAAAKAAARAALELFSEL